MVPPPCADDDVAALERELSVLLRRARAWSGELARTVHPDLEAAAYGLLTHVAAAGLGRRRCRSARAAAGPLQRCRRT